MKSIRILLLLILTGIIPLSCCSVEDTNYNMNLTRAWVQKNASIHFNLNDTIGKNETYRGDTLYLFLGIDGYGVSKAPARDIPGLTGSAWATSCPMGAFLFLENKIKSIKITSDTTFAHVPADEPIHDHVLFLWTSPQANTFYTVAEAVAAINTQKGPPYNRLQYLRITRRPQQRERHTFEITIDYENGDQDVALTPRIFWE